MSRMGQCKEGKRHKWTFVKNVVCTNYNGSCVIIKKRGRYKCECCGAVKIGQPDLNAEAGND